MGRFVTDVEKEVKEDIKVAKKMRLPWWGVLCLMLCMLPLVLFSDHFGRLNEAMPIMSVLAAFGLLLILKWRLAGRGWFWIVIGGSFALHMSLVLAIPWTGGWIPGLAWGGWASIDLCVMLVIVSVVERIADGPKTKKLPHESEN